MWPAQTSWKADHCPHRRHRLSRQFSGAGARPKPGTCQVRSEQPAGGQAADSFRRAFERGVEIAAADL
eukprot:scaffold14928_cov72-Phaeocystis_antarctica.AAC.4